jgi:hypothetical protein
MWNRKRLLAKAILNGFLKRPGFLQPTAYFAAEGATKDAKSSTFA